MMKERSQPSAPARILAVDDQESQLLALSGVLDDVGDELVGVLSGAEALERAARDEYAVILLDIGMPGMDGYETAARLRALPLARTTPIIFLTGGTLDAQTSAYAAGAVDFLVKPFVPEVLRCKVQVFLDLFRVRRAAQIQAELLRQSEEKHRIFTELTTDFTATLVVNPDGSLSLESLSDSFMRATGRGPADLFRPGAAEIVHVEDRPALAAALVSLRAGTPATGTVRVFTCTGEERLLRFWARPAGGAVQRILAAAQDLTEQRKLEDELRQAQKLEAVGRLAGGVAHDFNNMLTVILGNANLQLAAGVTGEVAEAADQIRGAADRAAALVAQLLSFSRRQLLTRSIFDLNEVVRTMQEMLHRVIGERIALTTSLASCPLVLHADRGRLEQAIVNLVMNARDAIPDGGAIALETKEDGGRALLTVSDTGTGMDPATRAQIFEPFFTTKAPGKGTGLGLPMVHGFVHQSGGELDVRSAPGDGSTFSIWLPLSAEALAPSGKKEARGAAAGRGTILVVEDEPAVRRLARASLEQCGYRVLEAADGGHAMKVAEEFGGTIDLLLTDVVMPGIRGTSLYEKMKVRRPEMKVLYVSGYAQDELAESFLGKPFTPAQLRERVNLLLAR